MLKLAGCKAIEFQGAKEKSLKALVKKLMEVPLENLESAFDFEDQTSSFYIERAPAKTKAKDKQAGYCGRLAKALAEGLWEEEEEEAPKSKKKRARSS